MLKNIFKAVKEFNEKLVYGNDVTSEQVESFLGVVALMYVTANADDSIDKKELEVIELYKYNMTRSLERPGREDLRDMFHTHLQELETIEKNKKSLKLSDALKYLPDEISNEMKEILKQMISEVIKVDGVVTDEEKEVKKNLCLYISQGKNAIEQIANLEK